MNPLLARIEAALDNGHLWAEMSANRRGFKVTYWQCRRNGRTQTWKTRPKEFRIPIKCGFRSTGEVTQSNIGYFKISETDPSIKA